ncbi:MAG: T9SS type A sorting domain-containing protein [Saprospiraceae bacterium]|nr:T9SS type A sorting domain-containing protein [Saprospiraceae bacterium]
MYKYLFAVITVILAFPMSGQNFWRDTNDSSVLLKSASEDRVLPSAFESKLLDLNTLTDYLSSAPHEQAKLRGEVGLLLNLPMPDGSMKQFNMFSSPVMEDGISARYPMIRSYKGFGVDDKAMMTRIAVSPYGFFASVSTNQGEIYIDPYTHETDTELYITYYTKNDPTNPYKDTDLCGFDNQFGNQTRHFNPMLRSLQSGEVEMREYRYAMACTGEWGVRRVTLTKALADMNVMVNRMNQIYEKELAIRFKLINDNDKLIFLDPNTDPYTDSDKGKSILPTNTGVLNGIVGSNAYDVGHVLSICFDIGGVAQGGSACQGNKGNGVTCHNDNNLISIVIRVMAHEVGHQFDASHTWNICQPNMPDIANQRAPSTAYEPGSGSTIMSYAGTCGADNVASDNDDYFHVGSLEQMYAKTTEGGNAYNCAAKIATGNTLPEIEIPAGGFVIPISTPFELTGSATDADDDNLTYVWEQFDTGVQAPLGSSEGSVPLFRSLKPGTNPTRFFPNANNIIANRLLEKNEVLPTTTRPLTFMFVVRDNNPVAGGVVWEELKFSSTATAGPFKITFPIGEVRVKVGDALNVTWDVANTDNAPVNCQRVHIYISLDGVLANGDPKLVPVALNVPNSGLARIIVPNVLTTRARFVIKAADNIFLTTSLINSVIEAPAEPALYMSVDNDQKSVCLPEGIDFAFNTLGFGGLSDSIRFEVVSGLPDGATATFDNNAVLAGESTTLSLDLGNVSGTSLNTIRVRAFVPGVDTLERDLILNVTGTDLSDIQLLKPVQGTSGQTALPRYSWDPKVDAVGYEIQVATSPSFDVSSIVTNLMRTDTFANSSVILEKSTIYYWRVRGVNTCGPGEWSEINAFITESLSCKTYPSGVQNIVIPGSGLPTVELNLNIFDSGMASDVNVKLVRGEHNRVGDLVAFLVSPSGKEVLLWSRKCSTSKNFSVGVDDQSPDFFQCPINTGRIYRPESPLSALNGEQINGNWKLRVEDRAAGEGGRLQELDLEICSNIALDQPFLIFNEKLRTAPGDRNSITDLLLLTGDANNNADQLDYTLVSVPKHGQLQKDNVPLEPGAVFTQADINAGKIKYKNFVQGDGTDHFRFTVTDKEGGWVPITTFVIDIDPSIPSSTDDKNLAKNLSVIPNPGSDVIFISYTGTNAGELQYQFYDMNGRIVMNGKMQSDNQSIVVSNLNNGVYVIRVNDGSRNYSTRWVKL